MSLTEVIVAMFILTLGVIGILTMFPLAAVQMARAVRDDRSALAASNADALMRWYWQTNVVENPIDWHFQPSTGWFDSPPTATAITQSVNNQNLYQNFGQMSYPVLVDPFGFYTRGTTFGEGAGTLIPRCSLFATTQSAPTQLIQPAINGLVSQQHLSSFPWKLCSLTDTVGFNENGTPSSDLELRYNWMWVLQRPQFNSAAPNTVLQLGFNQTNVINDQNMLTVNMTVVVFDRRTFGYPGPRVTGFEVVFPNTSFTSGQTTVTLNLSSVEQAADLKPGSWVMDATITQPANNQTIPIRQANFYRVVAVTPVAGSSTQVNLELQTPISAPTGYPPTGYSYSGTLVALNGVSGVFVRPPLTVRSN